MYFQSAHAPWIKMGLYFDFNSTKLCRFSSYLWSKDQVFDGPKSLRSYFFLVHLVSLLGFFLWTFTKMGTLNFIPWNVWNIFLWNKCFLPLSMWLLCSHTASMFFISWAQTNRGRWLLQNGSYRLASAEQKLFLKQHKRLFFCQSVRKHVLLFFLK